MAEQHGPDDEQLGTAEDIERLAEIGDLIRSGEARIEDFNLLRFELAFVRGYVRGGS
jgi:hypothetical protein